MNNFINFIKEINKQIGVDLPSKWQTLPDLEITQRFLNGINRFFYQTHENIGTTKFQEEELPYFSEFHKFWEANHQAVLNAKINLDQAKIAAQCLKNAIIKHGSNLLNITFNTIGLRPQAISQVRFFTANQDFREPPENQFEKYLKNPHQFDEKEIYEEPADFLRFLGMTKLSQTDKRLDFARNSAAFLIENKISAFNIAQYCQNDAIKIRETLIKTSNIGYGSKKANMFIRDMVELGVWSSLVNYEKIEVASDINTMKLALRLKIIQTDIPLISSFLDIFCYQYGYIDDMCALAWRTVWQEWCKIDKVLAPRSPCLMDFLLYRIGREYCKDNLVKNQCKKGHSFYHFGGQIKKCPTCKTLIEKKIYSLPCQVASSILPREDGKLLLKDNNLLRIFDGNCIFEKACMPKENKFILFDPPKSISVKGQTGWTSAYVDMNRGGGGMMS